MWSWEGSKAVRLHGHEQREKQLKSSVDGAGRGVLWLGHWRDHKGQNQCPYSIAVYHSVTGPATVFR